MYVYILKSLKNQSQEYIGSTSNLKRRLQYHNRGDERHTNQYKPWKIKAAFWLEDKSKGRRFEKYLKSGSGVAFRKKHF
jgi:predicted GIY-YIG superfamily endonuclease